MIYQIMIQLLAPQHVSVIFENMLSISWLYTVHVVSVDIKANTNVLKENVDVVITSICVLDD